jgi:hypothetical protein
VSTKTGELYKYASNWGRSYSELNSAFTGTNPKLELVPSSSSLAKIGFQDESFLGATGNSGAFAVEDLALCFLLSE